MIDGILELVAITAAAKLFWPDFEIGRTRMLMSPHHEAYSVPLYPEFAMISHPEDAAPRVTFGAERIMLKAFWTGHRYLHWGYGPRSDTLAVWMKRRSDD